MPSGAWWGSGGCNRTRAGAGAGGLERVLHTLFASGPGARAALLIAAVGQGAFIRRRAGAQRMLVIWRERGRARHGGYEGEDKGGIDETGRVLGGEEISRVPAAMARIEWWYLDVQRRASGVNMHALCLSRGLRLRGHRRERGWTGQTEISSRTRTVRSHGQRRHRRRRRGGWRAQWPRWIRHTVHATCARSLAEAV